MTVIRPNSVSGITSITAQANEINFFRSNGTLAGLQLNGVNFNTTTGVSTFNNLDVGGVLTYQDVTNVDSVGIITARSTIDAQGDISIVDKIIHTGDTNTALRFPAADTFSIETGGAERLRIDSNGYLGVGLDDPHLYYSPDLVVKAGAENGGITIRSAGTTHNNYLMFADGNSGDTRYDGYIKYNHQNRFFDFATAANVRLRITSTGKVNIGGDYTASTYGLQVYGSGGTNSASLGIKNNTAGPAGIHLLSGHGNWSIFNSWAVGDALEFRDESAGAIRAMIDSSGRFIVGHNSNINVAGHSSAFLLTGDTYQQHTAAIIANENTARGAMLQFAKQRSGSAGGNTIVQNGDNIGHMRFVACDGVDLNSRVAEITAQVDGTPGSNSTPGRLIFRTTPSGSDNALERLRINKDGHVTIPYQPSFRAGLNSNSTFASNADIVFNDTSATWHHNTGNHYNTSTGRFTAPVSGVYHFDACVIFGPSVTNNLFMGDAFLFYINGGYACYSGRRGYYVYGTTGNNYYTDHISCRFHMDATDYITVRNGSPFTAVHGNTYYTWFGGTLLG